jgi:hypothetical protein
MLGSIADGVTRNHDAAKLLESPDKNPLVSGGLTLMVIGSAAVVLRRVPAQVSAFIARRLSLSLEIPDRDPAFRWLQSWLATHQYSQRARPLRVDEMDERRVGKLGKCRLRLRRIVGPALGGQIRARAGSGNAFRDVVGSHPGAPASAPARAGGRGA